MKPRYKVMTLREIHRVKLNGYRVVSTFTGAGGSCLGYRMAGFKCVWANEFMEDARATYKANFPQACVCGDDIRKVKGEQVCKQAGVKVGELDVYEGSPPCSSFSTSGRTSDLWGKQKKYSKTVQRTDDLFMEYIRLLREIKPKVFTAENVKGLVTGVSKGVFIEVLTEMRASGYKVEVRCLDAKWLGVPQSRQRVFFVGVREDLGVGPAFPKPLPYSYSIKDACPWISNVVHDTSGLFSTGDCTNRPCPAITVGVGSLNASHFKVKVEKESSIARFAIGKEWQRLKVGEQSKRYRNLIRASADEPSPTITSRVVSAASVTHPYECRKFSIQELKRICSFPDDYVLTGSYEDQWERCGRAVPPLMAFHVARVVRDEILDKLK